MQVQTEEKKITFNCPKCAATLKVPRQLAGVSGPCPKCGGTIMAPHPTSVEAGQPSPSPATRPVQRDQPAPEPEKTDSQPVSPATLSPRMSVTSGPVEPAVSRPRPAPVEIEDLNESPSAPVSPAPASENHSTKEFPQSYQAAAEKRSGESVDPDSESFDDIDPEPAKAPESASSATAPPPIDEPSVKQTPRESLAPLPIQKVEKQEDQEIKVQTTQRRPAQPVKSVPTLSPEPPQAAQSETPRVSVSTIPARPKPEAIVPKPAHSQPPVVAEKSPTQQPQPQPVRRAVANVVPRIRKGGRQEAQTPPALDPSETRPISPVTKSEFQEPTQAQPAPATSETANAGSSPATPRLDASLGATSVNLDEKPLPSNPGPQRTATGPTKIRLPQLNEDSAPAAPPAVESVPMPPAMEQAPAQQNVETTPEPKPTHEPIPAPQGPGREPLGSLGQIQPTNDSRPVKIDRGLGDLILEDSQGAQKESQKTTEPSELDALFGGSNRSNGKGKRKGINWIKVSVAVAVFALSVVAVILIGNAFGGGFDLTDEGNPTTQGDAAANANDKPAVERPPEKPAIAPPEPSVVTVDDTPRENTGLPETTTAMVDTGSATNVEPATGSEETPKANSGFDKLVLSDPEGAYSTDTTDSTQDNSPLIFDTPGTVVPPGNEDIAEKIRQRIENAQNAISQGPTDAPPTPPSEAGVGSTAEAPIPQPEVKSTDGTAAATAAIATPPAPQPATTSAGATGPTGEFRSNPVNPAAMNGPPGPETFTPPSDSGSRLGSTRELIETFLKSPRWEDQIPYVYQSEQIKPVMEAYYKQFPYIPINKFALKFERMESDPEFNGPFWIYNVSTSDNSSGFPIVVRQEKDLLKIDWGVQAEFRDELFAKFQNGEITGKQSFRLIVERQTGYYESDAEVFTTIDDYLVYRIMPPYGGREHEETALVLLNSPIGAQLDELVPLYSDPLALIVEVENQSFPHKINHLVITKVTEGWFQ